MEEKACDRVKSQNFIPTESLLSFGSALLVVESNIAVERVLMSKKSRRMSFLILLFLGMSLNMGCCYLVKNEQHLVYSKAQYGSDKFVIVKDHHTLEFPEFFTRSQSIAESHRG